MEVPGKKEGDEDSTSLCLPCDRYGLKEPAYGFCQNCEEHLCEICYKNHRRPKPLRDHVLIDKVSMSKTKTSVSETADDSKDFCENHQDKPLEFYCKEHKSVACYVCVTMEHKHCHVDYIPDVSRNISDELNSMFKWMDLLLEKCVSNIQDAHKITQNMNQSYDEVVENVKLFRKEINEYLDRMEANIIREADAIKQDAKQKQETIKSACEGINEELEYLKSFLNILNEENKQTKLYIEMRNAEEFLTILSDKEKLVLEVNKTDDSIKFTRNTSMIEKLKTVNNFGQLSTYARPSPDRAIDLQFTGKINVKFPSDIEECNISGIVMIPPWKMILADRNNKSLKMIDIDVCSLVTDIRMSSSPADVITLPDNKLAVTLNLEKCIQIVSFTEKGFSLGRQIAVGETCNGVVYCQDKIVISCRASRKLLILNFAGNILRTLDYPGLFYGPLRVVISNDGKFLYVSDTDWSRKNKVVKIDWEGNVMNVFEEPGYNVPYGIQQLEDGTLLVGYRDSNTLMRLSSNLEKCEIIGLKRTNINNPKALTFIFREKATKLYVICSSKGWVFKEDVVKVFNINWV